MATATVTRDVTRTLTVTSGSPSSTLRAPAQAGILEHGNPSVYDPKNPLTLFIIQAGIIILFCRLLYYPLARIRQPRVIAEVIGGILLGPSVMGRIPGFSNAIFPPASLPVLTMAANLGLVLFLFLVGVEVDVRFLVSNARIALAVGTLGMALPFALGVAVAYGLYHEFISEPGTVPVGFGVFLVFVGIAMAITAFPVLCRILTELKLLHTPVGIIALSAGVGNDVVGWILLALCVALVNAGSGITALWVLLAAVGYSLLLIFAVRPAFMWYLRRTGSLQNGPTQSVMVATMLLVLVSAFFTSVMGIHPIFGGFLAGIILPHEGGFAIKVTEKIEDLVAVVFLPLYFALSGLNTNLGLLNNGITWAYLIAIIVIAFVTKVTGGTLAAKASGLVWRESFTIGVLMSCKGLVELIVLNIGLQAKILSTRTFTMFVVMALVVTFATTPLVSALYPHWYQVKLAAWKRGEIDWDGNRLEGAPGIDSDHERDSERTEVRKMLAYLRLDSMSGVMALISLLSRPAPVAKARIHPSYDTEPRAPVNMTEKEDADDDDELHSLTRPLQVYGMRLAELTDRESSVMRVSELDEYSARDPVVNALRTFGQIKNVAIAGQLAIATEANYASTLADHATEAAADLLLLPWSATGAMSETSSPLVSGKERFSNGAFSHFVLNALEKAPCTTAVFVDRGFGARQRSNGDNTDPSSSGRPMLMRRMSTLSQRSAWSRPAALISVPKGHHVLLPYFGTADDAAALQLVLQMARCDAAVTATIVQYETELSENAASPIAAEGEDEGAGASSPNPADATEAKSPTINHRFGLPSLERFTSNTHAANASFTTNAGVSHNEGMPTAEHTALFSALRESLSAEESSRVCFCTVRIPKRRLASEVVQRAQEEVGKTKHGAGDLVVLGRNLGLCAQFVDAAQTGKGKEQGNGDWTHGDARSWAESEPGRALGLLAGAVIRDLPRGSVLVVRAV